jgi:hypothetical protein
MKLGIYEVKKMRNLEEKPDECQTFDEWLNEFIVEEKILLIGDETLKLMKKSWNAGVYNACHWFGSYEGVDYGAWQLEVNI